MDRAMRGVVRDVLHRVVATGLPGNHHFFITFRTDHPGVVVPQRLRERYPTEMMIVLQHRFHALEVDEEKFSVTLSFGGMLERLTVPFAALLMFADPSVELARAFQPDMPPPMETPSVAGDDDDADGDDPDEPKTGEVVSLDSFRKK